MRHEKSWCTNQFRELHDVWLDRLDMAKLPLQYLDPEVEMRIVQLIQGTNLFTTGWTVQMTRSAITCRRHQ